MRSKQFILAICGAVSLSIGVYLLVSAKGSMDTFGEKVQREFAGDYSDHVKRQTMIGLGLIIIGGGVFLYSLQRK